MHQVIGRKKVTLGLVAGGDFSDTILGLDTIPGLGVEGSLLSDIIRLFFGASAATVGFVCEVAVASRGLGQIGAGDEGTKVAVTGTGGLASEAIELELLSFLRTLKKTPHQNYVLTSTQITQAHR